MLAFDPLSCAVAFSALEHVCSSRPHRAMQRARVWARRAPSEVMLDVVLNEMSDLVLGTINAMDPALVLAIGLIWLSALGMARATR
jgi:hypothetical protein